MVFVSTIREHVMTYIPSPSDYALPLSQSGL